MKKYIKIFIPLLIILILILLILFFKNEIFTFIWVKEYEHKYNNLNLIEKTISFNTTTNTLEENSININNFRISLSDFNFNANEKTLNFNLNFENGNDLNHVGYILRVYNNEYCLGDRFNGQISLDSSIEYIINYNKFYEKHFGYKSQAIDMTNILAPKNDLLNKCKMLKQDELLENGGLIHKISFELPEEFIINDNLKIELFDLNYQNIGDKTIYHAQEDLTQIEYTINLSEN